MIGEMNITDIFRDCDLIKRVVTKCLSNAKASDVKGYFGINFEIELCKEFNSNNNDYKLLTVKAVGELINGFQFSFQPFCNDFQDLLNKTNSTFDSMSKTDLLLFKKESDEFRLIDWSSCKTCNQWKGDKLLHETNMHLAKHPTHPSFLDFMYLKAKSFGINLKDIWN